MKVFNESFEKVREHLVASAGLELRDTPDDLSMITSCGQAAYMLATELKARGVFSVVTDATFERDGDYYEHFYTISRLGRRAIIADPTWIQFAPARLSNAPGLLVGDRSLVRQTLSEHRVPKEYLPHWVDADASVVYPNPKYVTDAKILELL